MNPPGSMGVSKPFTTPLQNSIHYMMARYAEMVVLMHSLKTSAAANSLLLTGSTGSNRRTAVMKRNSGTWIEVRRNRTSTALRNP